MGKKRERKLLDEIERLRSNSIARAERDAEARRKANEGLAAALSGMRDDAFLIVTKSGHVVKGRAKDAQMDQPMARVAYGGVPWAERVPYGPREYSASITIEPITDSEG